MFRILWVSPLLSLLLTSCGTPITEGDFHACLGSDDASVLSAGQASEVLLSGTVVASAGEEAAGYPLSDENWNCNDASYTLTVEDADGARWWLGLVVTSGDTDLAPTLDVAQGAAVDITFRQDMNESGAYTGVVVRDDTGLVFVGEDHRLELDDIPEIQISDGDVITEDNSDCGTRTWRQLTVRADNRLDLLPGETGALMVEGSYLTTWALNNYVWTEVQCTDMGASRAWAAWR